MLSLGGQRKGLTRQQVVGQAPLPTPALDERRQGLVANGGRRKAYGLQLWRAVGRRSMQQVQSTDLRDSAAEGVPCTILN